MTTLNDLDAIGGTSAKLWVSGETVTQWDYRKSPLDGEVYQRRTATGAGTTDPADDATNYVAKSFTRVTAIPDATVGPLAIGGTTSIYFAQGAVRPTVPAIANGVRTSVLSLTGRGNVGFVGFCRNGSSGDLRLEIVIDGRVVLNKLATFASNDCAVYYGAALPVYLFSSPINLVNAISDGVGLPFRRTFQVFVTPVTNTLVGTEFLAYKPRSEA